MNRPFRSAPSAVIAVLYLLSFCSAQSPPGEGELVLMGASWAGGGKPPASMLDRVKAHLVDGHLELNVTAQEFGSSGYLFLHYKLNGKEENKRFELGDHISLGTVNPGPQPPKPIAGASGQPDISPDAMQRLGDLGKAAGKPVQPTPFGLLIDGEGEVRTGNKLTVPVRIDVIAATDSNNIRLLFGDKGRIIFNWETNQKELRYHHPDSGNLWAGPNKGTVPTNQWVHLVWTIEPTRSTVVVDGETRAVVEGHYEGVTGTAGVGSFQGKVQICQLDFREMVMAGVAAAAGDNGSATAIARLQASIHGLAVIHTDAGEMLGDTLDLILTATRGNPSGATPVSFATPVGAQMQAAMEDAVRVVRVKYPNWAATKVDLSFDDRASSKDGGSIGAAIGTVLLSMLSGFEVDPRLAMTGDVTADGKIRAIGGIAAKLRGAASADCSIVAVPSDNLDQLLDAVIYDGPEVITNVQVIGMSRLDDAVAVARSDRDKRLAEAIADFASLQTILKKLPDRVKAKDSQDRLTHILDLAPNHLSARILLMIAQNKLPRKMSATASLYYTFVSVNQMLPTLFDRAKSDEKGHVTPAVIQTGLRNLRKTRGRADPKALPVIDALVDFVETFNAVETQKKPPQALEPKRKAVLDAMTKLDTDRALMEKMLREGV